MPFELDAKIYSEETLAKDPELKQKWDDSRMEHDILDELVKLRKEKGLTQKELAEMTGNKQQVISRIETHENSPTLKTLCSLVKVLDVDVKLVQR